MTDLKVRGFGTPDRESRAYKTRRLIELGYGPIEAHEAVTQGRAAEILGSQVVTPDMID